MLLNCIINKFKFTILTYAYNYSNLRGDIVKVVKSLMLMAMGATAVLLYQKYGDRMMIMVEDAIENYNCKCNELEE